MAFPDVLALLCASMTADLGVRTVTDLPANFTPPINQIAVITDQPRHKPWNGPALTTTVSVDLFFFGSATVSNPIGSLRDRAAAATDWLEAWVTPHVVVDVRSRPVRRPDFNPNVLRFGAVADFVCTRL
ncbi:hypothetical protein CH300_00090 [Rhodococcus sp. 15-1154-1]|nr:hypothetical protein [Rhodococcus sp. 15-1154-1]OZF09815.1 hypothetical protein CH300_00090 [Rhodococcus sp. 15-1154-1]